MQVKECSGQTDDVDCISAAAAEWSHCLSEIALGLSRCAAACFYPQFIPVTLAILYLFWTSNCRVGRSHLSEPRRAQRNLGQEPPGKRTAAGPLSLARYTPTPIKPSYAPADRQKVGLRQIASKLATAGKALQIPFFPAIPCDERDRDLSLRVTLMTSSRPCVRSRSVEGNRLVLRTITSRSSPGKRWKEESASALSSTSSQFPLKICRSIQPW